MTVPTLTTEANYVGDGATTVFPTTFAFLRNADVTVTVNGLTTGFTASISGAGTGASGSVTFLAAPAVGAAIHIERVLPLTQDQDVRNNETVYEDLIELALDRAMMIAQQIWSRLVALIATVSAQFSRTLRVPDGETIAELAAAGTRAGRFFGFDGAGAPAYLSGTGTDAALRTDLAASSGATLVSWLRSGSLISRTVRDKLERDLPLTPFDFGCAGDGATDDTVKLNAMAVVVTAIYDAVEDGHLNTRYPRLEFPTADGFLTSTGIALAGGTDVQMHSPLIVTAAAGTPIVGIDMLSTPGVYTKGPRRNRSVFYVLRANFSDWLSENDIGVRYAGHYSCQPTIRQSWGFTVGASVSLGISELYLGEIRQSKIGLLIRPPALHFTNGLNIHGGEIACDGGLNVGQARYGFELRGEVPAGINTVAMYGTSFELAKSVAGGADAVPILLNGTNANISMISGHNLRAEGCGAVLVKAVGRVSNVDIGFNYTEAEYSYPEISHLDQSGATGNTNIRVYRNQHFSNAGRWFPLFDSGKIAERILTYTGGFITIINMECATNVGAAPAVQTFTAGNYGPAIDANGYCSNGGPIYGVRIRTNGCRSFAVFCDQEVGGTSAGFFLMAFDAAGNQLTGNDVIWQGEGPDSALICETTVYGGRYYLNTSTPNTAAWATTTFTVKDTVATFFIACIRKHKRWQIKSIDARPEWFSVTSGAFRDKFTADALPIATANVNYLEGMVAEKLNKAVGAPPRWNYDTTGPAWRPEANL